MTTDQRIDTSPVRRTDPAAPAGSPDGKPIDGKDQANIKQAAERATIPQVQGQASLVAGSAPRDGFDPKTSAPNGVGPVSASPQAGTNPLDPGKDGWKTIQQGQVGDCYFLASLTEAAKNNPSGIRDMIRPNPDGTYTVSFKGKDPVTVDGKGIPNGVQADGRWAQIMEQAWEKQKGGPEKGGNPEDAIRALTGKKTASDETDGGILGSMRRGLGIEGNSVDDIRSALNNNRAAVVNSKDKPGDGIVGNHSYAVVGMDDKGNIELRNPWGSTPGTGPEPNGHQASPDGTFWISQEQLKRDFSDVDVQVS